MFGDEALWTPPLIQEPRGACVDRPDLGERNLGEKLHDQLADTSAPARRLMAEMLWITLLFPSNVGPEKKREMINDIRSLGDSTWDRSHPLIAHTVRSGIGSGGIGLNNHRWKELAFLIIWIARFKELPDVDRRRRPRHRLQDRPQLFLRRRRDRRRHRLGPRSSLWPAMEADICALWPTLRLGLPGSRVHPG